MRTGATGRRGRRERAPRSRRGCATATSRYKQHLLLALPAQRRLFNKHMTQIQAISLAALLLHALGYNCRR